MFSIRAHGRQLLAHGIGPTESTLCRPEMLWDPFGCGSLSLGVGIQVTCDHFAPNCQTQMKTIWFLVIYHLIYHNILFVVILMKNRQMIATTNRKQYVCWSFLRIGFAFWMICSGRICGATHGSPSHRALRVAERQRPCLFLIKLLV